METMPIGDILMNPMMGFFINGLNQERLLISSLSYTSYMLANINIILNKFRIKYVDLFGCKNN